MKRNKTDEAPIQVMVPGILVSLKSSVHGGVHYERYDIRTDEDGRRKQWETVRTMDDPEERTAAGETAGKAARLISKLCIRTSFGLLCPVDREKDLDVAVARMREVVREWNGRARYSFVSVSAIKGRIADNDEEAIRAILEEAKELLDRMDEGLAGDDVKAIRDAANRAKRLGEMMGDDPSGQITAAVAAARSAAKAIVKRGAAVGDKVANAVIEVERESFDKARFTFLDTMESVTEALPSVNLQRVADLEVD